MTITNSQIRARARSTLVGQYKVLILAALLARLIILAVRQYFFVSGTSMTALVLSWLISLIFSLLTGVLDAGASFLFLSAARQRPIRVGQLFYACKNQPDKPILITLMILLLNTALVMPFVLVWLLLVGRALPGGVIYTSLIALLINLPLKAVPVTAVLILIWSVPAVILNLTYSMALFFYVDHPGRPAAALMRSSREFMHGKKLPLFKLILSFAGYFLLGLLTLGVGFLWITPYVNMSEAIFYLEGERSFQEPI